MSNVSELPQPPRVRRPLLMSVGLIVAWFLGLRSLQEGWTSVQLVKDPLAIDGLAWPPEEVRVALLASMQANAAVVVPLGIAQALLGLVLVIIAGAALFGGRLPLRFFVQLLAASALVTLLVYWLGEPVRRDLVAALVQAPGVVDAGELDEHTRAEVFRWGYRLSLLLHLVALGFAMMAVTRRAAREFLASVPPPREN